MAAPDMTVSSPGQVNSAGDRRALYLKVFAGETLGMFMNQTVMKSRTLQRTITSGKSASFPASGKFSANYHTPGVMLVGQAMNHNEVLVTIDDVLIADFFEADIDKVLNHYETRQEYAEQAADALAQKYDQQLLQCAILAARGSANVTGGSGGTQITDADARTNADSLVDSIFEAAQKLDEKFVPKKNRYVGVKPDQYYQLINNTSKAINRDYSPNNGSVADGVIMRIAGVEVVETNNLPQTNVNSGPTNYQGDFTNTAAVVWHKAAAGSVTLMGLAVESDYLIQNQGWLTVAKYAVGHNKIRPECSVEIKVA
jgi:hypothetical protein